MRHDAAPRNLANAFETPVYAGKGGKLTEKSASELIKKANTLKAAYGGEEKTFVLNLTGATETMGEKVDTLESLLRKACAAVGN